MILQRFDNKSWAFLHRFLFYGLAGRDEFRGESGMHKQECGISDVDVRGSDRKSDVYARV